MKLDLKRVGHFIKLRFKVIYNPEITLGGIVQILIAIIALYFIVLEFKESIEIQTQNIESKINFALNPPTIAVGEVYRFDNYLSYIQLDSFGIDFEKVYLTYSLRGRKRHETLNYNDNYIIDDLPDFDYNIILKDIDEKGQKAEFLVLQTKKESVK